ncbi:MAG: Asp23/Gls24 family envelope stress response protein [Victivallales bacterium]|nr:Asp23/Gls24 family envelope stress response protein [Victivallales bacterium]
MATETTKAKEPELVAVNPNEDGSKGLVQVSPTVIASIVKKYALAVDGVLRLAPQSIGAGIADVFSRRTYERSLNLAFSENGVEITLSLVVLFGVNIPALSKSIQDVVFDKVTSITGYPVAKVNVNVVDLEEEQPAEEEEEENAEAPTAESN